MTKGRLTLTVIYCLSAEQTNLVERASSRYFHVVKQLPLHTGLVWEFDVAQPAVVVHWFVDVDTVVVVAEAGGSYQERCSTDVSKSCCYYSVLRPSVGNFHWLKFNKSKTVYMYSKKTDATFFVE